MRIRKEGREWVQTAKGPGTGGFERLEHNVPLPSAAAATAPPDIDRHQGHPIHALLVRALGKSEAGLKAMFETDVTRTARQARAGNASIEIALDRGQVRAGELSRPVLELEFELKEGTAGAAIALARSWCERYGLWLDPLSKSDLGWRLAHGDPAPEAFFAEALNGGRRHLVASMFESALRQILGNARELAADTGGDEHVHQVRVGIRRMRTALRELRASGAWEPPDPKLEAALRALFARLGEYRDKTTLLPALLQDLAAAGSPMKAWQPSLPDVGGAVREGAVQDAFVGLVGLVHGLHEDQGIAPKRIRTLASRRLRKLHGTLVTDAPRFEDLSLEDRHTVRKRIKRLRYLAELVRPLYGNGAVDAYVESLKDLQDALGQYQDAVAARALFQERTGEAPESWFAVGWLAAREGQLARDCAKACRKAARKAKPFWT